MGLSPRRQVGFLSNWLRHNLGNAESPLFRIDNDEDFRSVIKDIGITLGAYVGHPDFQAALRSVTRPSDGRYKKISGTHGILSSAMVQTLMEDYQLARLQLQMACDNPARAQGDNGVKQVNHQRYTAELKFIAMGNKRVFSLSAGPPYNFTEIGNHL